MIINIIKIILNKIKDIEDGLTLKLEAVSDYLLEKPCDLLPSNTINKISNYSLVEIKYRGHIFIGKAENYQTDNSDKMKICYLVEDKSMGVVLNKNNFQKIHINDIKYMYEHYDTWLLIAKILKTKSIITIVNVFNEYKKNNSLENLNKKILKKINRDYQYKLNLIKNTI